MEEIETTKKANQKFNQYITMKKLLFITAISIGILGCKKDDKPLIIGEYYMVKPHIFNTGVYRPVCPCRLDSLYIDPISNLPYAMIFGGQTGKGDYKPGNVEWYIPQEDLK